jgi:hypothetical protein
MSKEESMTFPDLYLSEKLPWFARNVRKSQESGLNLQVPIKSGFVENAERKLIPNE